MSSAGRLSVRRPRPRPRAGGRSLAAAAIATAARSADGSRVGAGMTDAGGRVGAARRSSRTGRALGLAERSVGPPPSTASQHDQLGGLRRIQVGGAPVAHEATHMRRPRHPLTGRPGLVASRAIGHPHPSVRPVAPSPLATERHRLHRDGIRPDALSSRSARGGAGLVQVGIAPAPGYRARRGARRPCRCGCADRPGPRRSGLRPSTVARGPGDRHPAQARGQQAADRLHVVVVQLGAEQLAPARRRAGGR